MSVLAGYSLFNGVLLASDSRVTLINCNNSEFYSDDVQKIFAIRPDTAIGFVGDIEIASRLLIELIKKLDRRQRKDPVSLMNWLPRLFQYEYSKYHSQFDDHPVVFMVASVLKNRPNIISRKEFEKLVSYIVFGHSPIKRNWMPGFLFEIIKMPKKIEWIVIPGSSRGILYVMKSPKFEASFYSPMQFVAIGSGESVYEEIAKYYDAVLSIEPGNSFIEGSQFRQIIQRFIYEKKIQSVGGLYPALKVSGRGVEYLTMATEIPVGGTKIELAFENARWIQRNVTTGKEIPLLYPWELTLGEIIKEKKFDDFKKAFEDFKGNN